MLEPIYKGTYYPLQLTVRKDDVVEDISEGTVDLYIGKTLEITKAQIHIIGVFITDGTDGKSNVDVPDESSANVEPGRYQVKAIYTDVDGDPYTVLVDEIDILP